MSTAKIERKYWVLLALDSAKGNSLTPIQLQKSIFLIGKKLEIPEERFYSFAPYDYGPFSVDVYRDAEELEKDGLINIAYASNMKWRLYSITASGAKLAAKTRDELDKTESAGINEVLETILSLGFRELVKSIYKEYPEYSVNSVFRG